MANVIISLAVGLLFGSVALWGERVQRWLTDRRLRRHTCHTTCLESRWCRCGCADGLFGTLAGTCCAVCGTQYVDDPEEYVGPYFATPTVYRSRPFMWGSLPGEKRDHE